MADESSAVAQPTTIGDLKRKTKVEGTVKRIELYGAFIDIGTGTPAILHVSKLGDKGSRVADAVTLEEKVTVWVDKVDVEKNQVMVTMAEPLAVEWGDLQKGGSYTGKVTRLENFGAFVAIGAEKDGLVHVSEISHDFIKDPKQALAVGDEVEVQLLDFSKRKRRINLSIKNLLEKPEPQSGGGGGSNTRYRNEAAGSDFQDFENEVEEEVPTAMEYAIRRAMSDDKDNEDYVFERRRGGGGKNKKRDRRRRQRERDAIIAKTLEITNH